MVKLEATHEVYLKHGGQERFVCIWGTGPGHEQSQLTALVQRHRKIFSDNALLGVEE